VVEIQSRQQSTRALNCICDIYILHLNRLQPYGMYIVQPDFTQHVRHFLIPQKRRHTNVFSTSLIQKKSNLKTVKMDAFTDCFFSVGYFHFILFLNDLFDCYREKLYLHRKFFQKIQTLYCMNLLITLSLL